MGFFTIHLRGRFDRAVTVNVGLIGRCRQGAPCSRSSGHYFGPLSRFRCFAFSRLERRHNASRRVNKAMQRSNRTHGPVSSVSSSLFSASPSDKCLNVATSVEAALKVYVSAFSFWEFAVTIPFSLEAFAQPWAAFRLC